MKEKNGEGFSMVKGQVKVELVRPIQQICSEGLLYAIYCAFKNTRKKVRQ